MTSIATARLITDKNGRKQVVLPLAVYEKMLEMVEELEDIRAADEARDDESIPLEQAMAEIYAERKKLGL